MTLRRALARNRESQRELSDLVRYPVPKRLLDKAVALLLTVLLLPVAVVALGAMGLDMLRTWEDRGPWLYREPRISRGRRFELLKFRTLRRSVLDRSDGEAHARLLEADESNLTWAGRRVLKPWYLDELPQLLNILRGDMSLVGPRPWPPSMVATQVEQGLDYRNRIIAGWTGPVQVQKGIVEPADYTTLDLEYVDACRSWPDFRLVRYDLGILWRTIRVLARGEGLTY